MTSTSRTILKAALLGAIVGAAGMALANALGANPHALGPRPCHVANVRWTDMALEQQAKLARCNARHARYAIAWVRAHRENYNTRTLASVADKVVADHRALIKKADRNLRAIQDRIYFTGTWAERYRVVSEIICSLDWSPTSCAGAVQVSRCETGGTFTAEPGDDPSSQYRGLFELGNSERREYGVGRYHSGTYSDVYAGAWDQVTAAHTMYVRNGRSWSRWACRPDGSVAY